ncbi:MAG: ECF transporter S component [Clostridia bacterium]|nr:ECF transporter S component [Clostridia bacterium]
MKTNQQSKTLKLATIAMLSAISFVLFLIEFPVIPAFSHLKLDFSDIPAIIGGLLYGPHWAIFIELIKNVIELAVKGMGTQMGFGNIMNFIVGCAYVVPFCVVYKALSKKEKISKTVSILVASVVGVVSIIVLGIIGNYFIDPPFFKYFLGIELSSEALWSAIWAATAVNAIKGAMLSVLGFPLVLVLIERLNKVLKIK